MRVTADTNLLVRMATRDDEAQAQIAFRILTSAEQLIVPLPCVLEFVWVLKSIYSFSRQEVADAIATLIDSDTVLTDLPAIETGLRVHAAGGDFADGLIAGAGAGMGAEVFVSFDRKAVMQVAKIGLESHHATTLP